MKINKYLAVMSVFAASACFVKAETIIDMVVQYTPERVSAYGTADNLISAVRGSQDIMNNAYRESNTTAVSIRAFRKNNYNPGSKSGNQIWTDFRNNVTGANSMINEFGSDTACEIVALPGLAGIAGGHHLCVASLRTHTMAHEMGHCLGLNHGYPTLSAGIGNGYQFNGKSGKQFKDIMAGNYVSGTQINLFSASFRTYDGVPRGIAGSRDCGTRINQTKAGLANYKTRIK